MTIDLNFDVVHRIECSGETKWMNQLACIAEAHGASLYTWESGQFGIANPQYRVPAMRSAAFLAALDGAQFLHAFVKTLNP